MPGQLFEQTGLKGLQSTSLGALFASHRTSGLCITSSHTPHGGTVLSSTITYSPTNGAVHAGRPHDARTHHVNHVHQLHTGHSLRVEVGNGSMMR